MNDERIDLYKQFEGINYIDPSYYEKFRVKRGLRNADGTGVLAGMTNISNVHGYLLSDGDAVTWYYTCRDLAAGGGTRG